MKAMRVLGIDPGSVSWDFFGYEKEKGNRTVFLDYSLPTNQIKENPEIVIELISRHLPLDSIAAPSGFGLPLREFSKNNPITIEELELITLRKSEDKEIMGLTKVINLLHEIPARLFILPGVKHFRSIPQHRKINLIDMGTAEKVCNVVMGINQLMVEKGLKSPSTVNFILCEIGRGFTALVAVENGKIIDGIGGSNIIGYNTLGKFDGELVYLIKDSLTGKKSVYQGGLKDIIINTETNGLDYEKNSQYPQWVHFLAEHLDDSVAGKFFVEEIQKALLQLLGSFDSISFPIPILIAGSGISPQILKEKIENIGTKFKSQLFKVGILHSHAINAKSAAQGAAFMAEGLLRGDYHPILQHLGIFSTSGTVLDDIFFPYRLKNN